MKPTPVSYTHLDVYKRQGGRYWSGATVFKAKKHFEASVTYLEQQRNGILLFREGGGGVLQK